MLLHYGNICSTILMMFCGHVTVLPNFTLAPVTQLQTENKKGQQNLKLL